VKQLYWLSVATNLASLKEVEDEEDATMEEFMEDWDAEIAEIFYDCVELSAEYRVGGRLSSFSIRYSAKCCTSFAMKCI